METSGNFMDLFEDLTWQQLNKKLMKQCFKETSESTGIGIPEIGFVVNFVLNTTSDMIQNNERVSIKFDGIGKLYYIGEERKKTNEARLKKKEDESTRSVRGNGQRTSQNKPRFESDEIFQDDY